MCPKKAVVCVIECSRKERSVWRVYVGEVEGKKLKNLKPVKEAPALVLAGGAATALCASPEARAYEKRWSEVLGLPIFDDVAMEGM